MSTTPIPMPAPQTENPGAQAEYLRQMLSMQTNTEGMTQMAPGGAPQAPVTQQRQNPGQQETSSFGVGEKGAHQRQSMGNLVKASQTLANQFSQYAEAKQQREYQQVVGKFTQATQGVAQANAQVIQASQALKKDPNDPQAQAQLKTAQAALQQNQAILNDMANDKKQHKVITKAFGIDDKNADSPERQAAMKVLQAQGQNQAQARIQSQIPQTQQLSPQAQAQGEMQKAGVVGKPATQGQILTAYGKMYDTGVKAGLTQEKLDLEMNKRGLTVKTDDDGNRLFNDDGTPQLRPMTEQEINENPVTKSQMDFKAAQTAAQKAAADAKTNPDNPEMKLKALDTQARLLSAQASMLRAQKYVPGGETPQKQQDTQYLAKQLIEGKLAPSELPSFGAARSEAMAAASKMDPNFDPAKADVQYKFANNPRVQQQLSLINSLTGYGDTKGSLDEVLAQSAKIKRSQFPPVNSAEMTALIASGNKDAAAYAAVATDVADQIGQIMAAGGTGGSSDFKLRQAQAVLSGKFTPQQLASTAKELKTLLANRQKAFLEQGGPYLKAQQAEIGDSKTSTPDTSADPLGILK